jgi:hypothetical protein
VSLLADVSKKLFAGGSTKSRHFPSDTKPAAKEQSVYLKIISQEEAHEFVKDFIRTKPPLGLWYLNEGGSPNAVRDVMDEFKLAVSTAYTQHSYNKVLPLSTDGFMKYVMDVLKTDFVDGHEQSMRDFVAHPLLPGQPPLNHRFQFASMVTRFLLEMDDDTSAVIKEVNQMPLVQDSFYAFGISLAHSKTVQVYYFLVFLFLILKPMPYILCDFHSQQVIKELDVSSDKTLYKSFCNKRIKDHLSPELLAAQAISVLHRSDEHGNIKTASKNQRYSLKMNKLLIDKFQTFCEAFPEYTFFGGIHGCSPRFKNGTHYAQCTKEHQRMMQHSEDMLDSALDEFVH